MKAQFFATAFLIASAQADFSGDISAVNSAAKELKSKVDGWSSNNGLLGALGIQNDFPNLSKAVVTLSKDAQSVKDSDIDASSVNSLASSITGVLSSLTNKASDFKSVGASDIVKNDLEGIGGPATGAVNGIIKGIGSDTDKLKQLTSALNAIDQGFSSVNSAYGANQITFSKPSV